MDIGERDGVEDRSLVGEGEGDAVGETEPLVLLDVDWETGSENSLARRLGDCEEVALEEAAGLDERSGKAEALNKDGQPLDITRMRLFPLSAT